MAAQPGKRLLPKPQPLVARSDWISLASGDQPSKCFTARRSALSNGESGVLTRAFSTVDGPFSSPVFSRVAEYDIFDGRSITCIFKDAFEPCHFDVVLQHINHGGPGKPAQAYTIQRSLLEGVRKLAEKLEVASLVALCDVQLQMEKRDSDTSTASATGKRGRPDKEVKKEKEKETDTEEGTEEGEETEEECDPAQVHRHRPTRVRTGTEQATKRVHTATETNGSVPSSPLPPQAPDSGTSTGMTEERRMLWKSYIALRKGILADSWKTPAKTKWMLEKLERDEQMLFSRGTS
jgi:hypothetical protein